MTTQKKERGIKKGMQLWKLRGKHGPSFKFVSPDDLWQRACEYFEWADSNPITDDTPRAYTLQGLCLFLDIGFTTWLLYRTRAEFADIVEKIEMICFDQKFTEAAANRLNHNIISRELGLIDRQEHTLQPKQQHDLSNLTDEELQLFYDLQKKMTDGPKTISGTLQAPEVQIHNREEREEPRQTGTSVIDSNG